MQRLMHEGLFMPAQFDVQASGKLHWVRTFRLGSLSGACLELHLHRQVTAGPVLRGPPRTTVAGAGLGIDGKYPEAPWNSCVIASCGFVEVVFA